MKLKDRIIEGFKLKKRLQLQGKGKFTESFNHAVDGISYTANHERNFRIELCFAIGVTIASYLFKVTIIEWCILVITIGIVLALEIINTAIERSVDLVTKQYAELAKIAKDASAGAVLVMSFVSVIIGVLIFLPRILTVLS